MSKIKTTTELRAFLCKAINDTADGTMGPDKAKNIAKLAAQVNGSINAEVNVAKLQLELDKESKEFGELPLSDCK